MEELRIAYLSGHLSARSFNVLAGNGYRTWRDVEALGEDGLTKVRGLGAKSLEEIQRLLREPPATTKPDAKGVAISLREPDLVEEPNAGTQGYSGRESLAEALVRADLSTRTYRLLLQLGFRTTGDLATASEHDLESQVTGAAAVNQVKAIRAAVGRGPMTGVEPPLARLTRLALDALSDQQVNVLRRREYETLQEIADSDGVTRERIRQIEAKASRFLASLALGEPEMLSAWTTAIDVPAVHEDLLVAPYVDPVRGVTTRERDLARMLLRSVGARHPRRFNGEQLQCHWTSDPWRLVGELRELVAFMPCGDEELEIALEPLGLDPRLDVRDLLDDPESPARYIARIESWVRAVGRDRDAAWILLQRRGVPTDVDELAAELELVPHNLEEAMRRDDRFIQVLPQRTWAIADWNIESSPYATTLEAVMAVLAEMGPQPLAQLTRNVLSRYPVTPGAVQQCLNHVEIGRWPDGRVDLASRGAPPIEETEPKRPNGVFLENGGATIAIHQPVTKDLLRGSGLGLHRYVSWFLGMRTSPDDRTFHTHQGDTIVVRRRIHGSSISTLRAIAERLGASLGCALAVRLHPDSGEAEVTLACNGSCKLHRRAHSYQEHAI